MGQGLAQKRRLKNFLKAKETKSGRLTMLPPPPEEVVKKKGKRQQATSDMPRSLQRMLQLKAVAESRKRTGGKKDNLAQSTSQAKPKPMQEAAPATEEEVLEAQLAEDPHKPKFGEQAMAPIKVNLKRKHWDPNASQGRSSKRCTHIFQQQLANARQQGGSQQGTQAAAATQRGQHEGAGRAKGKKALKPWQLKKEKVSQQAAQGVMQASAIEAYRSLKHSQGNGNGATLQSLKELVKRDADRSAQQAAS
ncbi:hypothetical protein WJX75_003642 [Coccomyxa subellipsoidea]|uniref:Uncharacterized protein n=1 Tax=Coccomyxa subellipsoidea TaxID=248742 RepID=A0ABR2YPJ1_9CHLO